MTTTAAPQTHITAIIEARGLRRDWLAARLGVSPSYLTRLLNGQRRMQPSIAIRMADVLQLPVDFIQPKHEA